MNILNYFSTPVIEVAKIELEEPKANENCATDDENRDQVTISPISSAHEITDNLQLPSSVDLNLNVNTSKDGLMKGGNLKVRTPRSRSLSPEKRKANFIN